MDFSGSKLRIITTKRSTTFTQQFQEIRESNLWPLDEQLWNSCVSGLAMLQSSSSKLVQVFGRDLEVQWFLIRAKFDFTMDEFKLQAAPMCTNSCDSKSNNDQWCFRVMNQVVDCALVWRNVKKIWEKKFEEFSRSEICVCCYAETVRIYYIYAVLIIP